MVLEELFHFNYLGCNVSYDFYNELEKNVNRLQTICDVMNRIVGCRVMKEEWDYTKHAVDPVNNFFCNESWVITKKQGNYVPVNEVQL